MNLMMYQLWFMRWVIQFTLTIQEKNKVIIMQDIQLALQYGEYNFDFLKL